MSPTPTPDPNTQASAATATTASSTANPVSLLATTATVRTGSSRLHDIQFLKNNGSKFLTWKFRISHVLMTRGLWNIVSGTENAP
ncbi:hypothetical protein C8T65DRAFT_578714, partial [Cerioporus squamosus]